MQNSKRDPQPRKRSQPSQPRKLDVVQQWFQEVIAHPDGVDEGMSSPAAQQWIRLQRDELEEVILRSRNLTAQERVNIYANAYYARLVECLGECYPVFRRAMGQDVFSGFAFEYLQHYPSRSYTLDHLGDHFVRFLKETRPDHADSDGAQAETSWPDFLIDLATLEWTIAQIFDGPGVEQEKTLTATDLLAVPAQHFAQAKLLPVVCLRLLQFHYPVNAYFSATRRAGEEEEIPIPEAGEEVVAITRRDYIVRRYTLTVPQKVLLQSLQEGRTVGESIAVAAEISEMDDEELAAQLHSWFRFWTAEQFFQSIEVEVS